MSKVEVTGEEMRDLLNENIRLKNQVVALEGKLDEVRTLLSAAMDRLDAWQEAYRAAKEKSRR